MLREMMKAAGLTSTREDEDKFERLPRHVQIEMVIEYARMAGPTECTCNCICEKCDPDEEV